MCDLWVFPALFVVMKDTADANTSTRASRVNLLLLVGLVPTMLVTFVYLSEIVLGKSLGTFTSLTFNDVTMVNFGLVPDYWRGLPYCKTKSACDYDSTTHSCHTLTGMDTAITGDISPDCLATSADAYEHFMMPLHP